MLYDNCHDAAKYMCIVMSDTNSNSNFMAPSTIVEIQLFSLRINQTLSSIWLPKYIHNIHQLIFIVTNPIHEKLKLSNLEWLYVSISRERLILCSQT